MEFPDLGQHCSQEYCKQLDFLPVKCDSCHKVFCNEHFRYDKHNCPESYRKDNQVPVCPLCNTPISVKKGQAPDLVVGQHIDNDCKQKKKQVSNKCNVKGCKQKELIPVLCDKCRNNFCLRHRLAEDHQCAGFEGTGRGISNQGAAASTRAGNTSTANGPFKVSAKPQKTTMSSMGGDLDRQRRERDVRRGQGTNVNSYQAGMSEDEAMARALAMSMSTDPPQSQSSSQTSQSAKSKQEQEEEDMALARALQASEEETRRTQRVQAVN